MRRYIQAAELLDIVDTFIEHEHDEHDCLEDCCGGVWDSVTSDSPTGTADSPTVFRGAVQDSVTSTATTSTGVFRGRGATRDSVTSTGESTPPAAFRVLLAADSRANEVVTRLLLMAQGVDVTVVEGGSAAVAKLVDEGGEFDLAFFDIDMPIMGGVEAMRQVRAAGIDMPIIALTASVEPDELRVGTIRYDSPRHRTSCMSR